MRDLSSPRWIVAKGLLFFVIAASAGMLLWMERPTVRVAKYVDPRLRYAGVVALLRAVVRRRT